jgi:hypothetical protein
MTTFAICLSSRILKGEALLSKIIPFAGSRIYRWQTMSKGPRIVDVPGTGKIFLNKKLLIFSHT